MALNTWLNVVHISFLVLYPFCLFNQSYFNSPLFFCSTLKYPRRRLPPMPSTILIFTCLTWARTTLREASSASTNMCQGRGLISATQLTQLLLMGHIHLSLPLSPPPSIADPPTVQGPHICDRWRRCRTKSQCAPPATPTR